MASYNGHDYVEIDGVKWATMNVSASTITDTGLYFQWGDTHGYTSALVGPNTTAYKKPFNWADYKYGNGKSSPGSTGMTKYNASDKKTVLDLSDDPVRAYWGDGWRLPTTSEFELLDGAVTTAWTYNYQGSGVNGLLCTAIGDSSKKLFFPAAGLCYNGSLSENGESLYYWTRSLYGNKVSAYSIYGYGEEEEDVGYVQWDDYYTRYYGFPVRGVVDD